MLLIIFTTIGIVFCATDLGVISTHFFAPPMLLISQKNNRGNAICASTVSRSFC